MLELTRRELISSAIAAAGLMATSPISSAAAPKKPIVYAGTLGRRSVASLSTDQQGHHRPRCSETSYGRTGRT